MNSPIADPLETIFPGTSQMARKMRAHDWEATALGHPSSWPDGLKIPMRMLLTSRFEMWLGWGKDLRFFYNDAYIPTLGIKHPRALGEPFHEVWSEVYGDVADQVARVRAGESTWNDAMELLLERSGYPEETYHSFSYSPLWDSDGSVGGMLCVVSEESERVIGERQLETLRRLGMNLVGLTEEAQVHAAVCDVFAANRRDFPFAVLALGGSAGPIGCTPDIGALASAALALAPAIDPKHPAVFALDPALPWPTGGWNTPPRDALHVPVPGVAEGSLFGSLVLALNPYRRADAPLDDFARLIAGQVSGALASLFALEGERRRADRIWMHSRDMMVVIDRSGTFRSVSPSSQAILGFHPDQVVGRNLTEFVISDDVTMSQAALATALGESDLTGFENRFRTRDGGFRWISWHTAMEGELVYAYGRDITDDKANAAALSQAQDALRHSQKMEAVGQLTGGIAHDFNNLLTGIGGSLEIIGRRLAQGRSDGIERFLDGAKGSVQRAASLTQRLLAFSRRQTLDPRAVDVRALVAGMRELFEGTAGPAIAIDVACDEDLWAIRVDASQLENALLNLVINARDALPQGGTIRIEAQNVVVDAAQASRGVPGLVTSLAPGSYVALRVRDNGTGIAPEIVERIFDPFFTTKPIGQGTGLGLSMIHGFVVQSGGGLRASSKPGRGTTMTMCFPRHLGQAGDEAPPAPAGAEGGGAGETVLVIDDEGMIRTLITDSLADAGYRTLEAADGQAGLAILRSDARIDLLVTDVGLPGGLNGRQVADAARALRPSLRVLFITGYAAKGALGDGALPAGMEVMTKPFALADLSARVFELLEAGPLPLPAMLIRPPVER